jgi:hypothetical protein
MTLPHKIMYHLHNLSYITQILGLIQLANGFMDPNFGQNSKQNRLFWGDGSNANVLHKSRNLETLIA